MSESFLYIKLLIDKVQLSNDDRQKAYAHLKRLYEKATEDTQIDAKES